MGRFVQVSVPVGTGTTAVIEAQPLPTTQTRARREFVSVSGYQPRQRDRLIPCGRRKGCG